MMRIGRQKHTSNEQDGAKAREVRVERSPTALDHVMSLQGSIGNAAVSRLLGAKERASVEAATPVNPDTQRAIDAQAGAGEALNVPLQAEMEGLVGGPLDGVRIHQGVDSDALTRGLGATALTQGKDVFLRSDREPTSEKGRTTLAHELTHVAQGSVGPGAVLREPDPEQQRVPALVASITLEKHGAVKGESRVAGHEGELELDSLSFERSGSGGSGVGRPGGASQQFIDLLVTKTADSASPVLANATATGERITTARFTFLRRRDDGSVENRMSLEFSNGFITSFSTGGGGADRPSDSLGLQFEAPK